MAETEQTLLDIVNASGFLFQIRVEHEIKQAVQKHYSRWMIPAREHRWIDPLSGDEKFIDLVLQSGLGRMVIECKRTTDGQWLFLVPDNQSDMQHARLFWTDRLDGSQDMVGWDEFTIHPKSPESSFCTTRGKGEADQPMLERIASTLLRSAESLANEELALGRKTDLAVTRIYLPVIITNAVLNVCRFQTSQTDLSTGKVDLNNVTFDTAPLIRFRKNLSTITSPTKSPDDLAKANTENERTVFIINAVELSKILRGWKIEKFGLSSNLQWPWEKARSQK